MTISNLADSHGELLLRERFECMCADFRSWRMCNFIRQLEASKGKGRILPFIRGLRLSAQLVYAIRELLIGSGLTANWGHLLDEEQKFCSPECDVIIHKETGQLRQWNGTREPVMDFRFVLMTEAVVVISCKSLVRPKDIEVEYAEQVKEYVDRLWLFGECCGPRSITSLSQKAQMAGYEHFWHLYTWSPKTEEKFNRQGWNNFVSEVRELIS
ncbi:MAG: hypothetical protein JSW13_01370 [Candidatus Aerophobus sp.]|nr:MAG: hypothetical protein JSW13_01370 [Candidatus Aerophobus sp.]